MSPLQKLFQEKFKSINKSVFTNDSLVVDQDIIKFRYLPKTENEFEVSLELYQNGYSIYCGGWHDYTEKDESESDDQFADDIIKKMEIIFSGKIKLKIFFAGKKPYRWEIVPDKSENKISPLGTTSLIFYNYFASKTTIEKQNKLV